MNERMFDDGVRQQQGYTPGSPQDVILAATGMDTDNIVRALRDMIKNGPIEYKRAQRVVL